MAAPTTGAMIAAISSEWAAVSTSKLYWDDANTRLGIGAATPGYSLTFGTYSGTNISFGGYGFVGSMQSGADLFMGMNCYSISSSRVLKQSVSSWYASFIKMYYNQGIQFGTVNAAGSAGDTVHDPAGTTNIRMTISQAGSVGIGTASPTSPLQVVGLPSYASNADAVAAGLTAGAMYVLSNYVAVVY